MIEQYLRSHGKERYLRSEDKSKSVFSNLNFIYKLFSSESEVITSFGQPMDVLGNNVDAEGNSYDKDGNRVELGEYFIRNDMIVKDEQRESVYTKELSEKIVSRYKRDNLVLSSHLVAFTAFKILERENPDQDIFGVLRLPEEEFEIDKEEFLKQLSLILQKLIALSEQGRLRLPSGFKNTPEVILKEGLNKIGIYHAEQPLALKKDKIYSENFKLLYYYHNRLEGYGLDLSEL